MEEIKFIESMQVLDIRANDVLVVKLSEKVSPSTVEHIAESVKWSLPVTLKNNVKILVIVPGTDLGVLRPSVQIQFPLGTLCYFPAGQVPEGWEEEISSDPGLVVARRVK